MERENVLEKNMCNYSKPAEIIQIILICFVALAVPTWLGKLLTMSFGVNSWIVIHSQIIVGTIVNVALMTAAINIKGWKKLFGIITLPSISAILGGYVFATSSVYTVYMIPAIWLGNFSIIYLYKLLLLNKKLNYFISGSISISVKVGIIFLGFNILNLAGIFPNEKIIETLKSAMGITQLITASIAMCITYTLYFANKKKIENNCRRANKLAIIGK